LSSEICWSVSRISFSSYFELETEALELLPPLLTELVLFFDFLPPEIVEPVLFLPFFELALSDFFF
jgi:hypothetical protein